MTSIPRGGEARTGAGPVDQFWQQMAAQVVQRVAPQLIAEYRLLFQGAPTANRATVKWLENYLHGYGCTKAHLAELQQAALLIDSHGSGGAS
jgi:hypothetical protein